MNPSKVADGMSAHVKVLGVVGNVIKVDGGEIHLDAGIKRADWYAPNFVFGNYKMPRMTEEEWGRNIGVELRYWLK
ncbi:MAG: hypothetical protein WC822_04595 [Candidatus Paceibacterota bacterium]|jgi:hypothetical protein